MKNLLVIFLILLLGLASLYYYKISKSREGILFRKPYFLEKYKRDNIIIDPEEKTLQKGDIVKSYKLHFNPRKSINIADDKLKTSRFLKKHNIPVPNFIEWKRNETTEKNLNKVERNLNYPLVIKPTRGTQGYGVRANIKTKKQLLKHIDRLEDRKTIVEEQHMGNDYRILMLDDKIIGVIERATPVVVGDGKRTLLQLINKHKYSDYKTHTFDRSLIKEQNCDLNTIIPKNKEIMLTYVKNYHNGAQLNLVPIESIHEDNIKLFKNINKLMDMRLSGIDFISNDLSIPFYEEGVVIEINPFPGGSVFELADNQDELVNYFIDGIFEK